MGVDIVTGAGTVCRLRLFRLPDLPPFDQDDKRRLAVLVPHIKQALTLAAHATRNEAEREIYEEGLDRLNIGVVVLDERAQLLRANPVACHILTAGDGLRLSGRELEACTTAETRELRRLINGTAIDGDAAMSLSRPSGRRKMAAVVRSIPMIEESEGRSRPAYAVFLRDPDAQTKPAQDMARQLFSFTPAEANFAVELVNGLSLDEAAIKLGIRRNTARAYLRAIFVKAGVTRQSELVRVLLNAMLGLELQRN
jgi:DNA-binding CsgD family transcriptional regulator